MTRLQMLEKFHRTFNIEKPKTLTKDLHDLRFKLLMEEWNEYCEAVHKLREEPENELALIELLDAMADMCYIIEGTAELYGMDLAGAFKEVQDSNMSKLDDEGNPIINGVNCELDETRPHGKILKSKNFFEPNLKPFIRKG